MEPSARAKALYEPAILYQILHYLSPEELLRAQSVCRTWHSILSTDSRLLKMMWLYPDVSGDHDHQTTAEINPMLQRVFPNLLKRGSFRDPFTTTMTDINDPPPTVDLYMELYARSHKRSHAIRAMKYPNASWRRMVPCLPAPDQLVVNVCWRQSKSHLPEPDRLEFNDEDVERGKLLWLNFSNQNVQHTPPSRTHPPWLTFGLMYDIVECAWHEGRPWRLHEIRLDIPGGKMEHYHRYDNPFIPTDAVISDELKATDESRPGRVRLNLMPDTRSEAERQKVHEKAEAAYLRQRRKVAKHAKCGNGRRIWPHTQHTGDVHFADALSLDDIEWDEAHEYDLPPRQPPITRAARRRQWGF